MKSSLKTFLNYASVFIVFSGAWSLVSWQWRALFGVRGISFAEFRFFYLIMAAVLLLWRPVPRGVHINRIFLVLFLILIFLSLFNVLGGSDSIGLLTKQFIGIFVSAFFFYFLLKVNDYDVRRLFEIYLNIAFFVALLGIIQEVSFLVGFKPGYDYSYFIPFWKATLTADCKLLRVSSIFVEPQRFCNVMMPAFFVSLASFFNSNFKLQKRWKSLIIIISFILTFSTAGYFCAFFSFFLLLVNHRKIRYLMVCLLCVYLVTYFAYNNAGQFRVKVDQSLSVIKGEIRLETLNASVAAFFYNAIVAYNSFKENPLFGSGLGSHRISFEKHVGTTLPIHIHKSVFNKEDANSFFFRLLSETGLLGILAFIYFIFKHYIPRLGDESGYLWIISNAVLALFFIKLLRMGHYFVDGFFFFLWLYYFSKIKLRELHEQTA